MSILDPRYALATREAATRPSKGDRMKRLQELAQTMGEHLSRGANVKSVFGEPVVVGKKTVIPVARIGYGYGAGFGGADADEGEGSGKGGGGGLGAGLGARPAGVLEITRKRTRFIPYRKGRGAGWVLGLGLGVALGLALGRSRK